MAFSFLGFSKICLVIKILQMKKLFAESYSADFILHVCKRYPGGLRIEAMSGASLYESIIENWAKQW